jgi:hypothetical protein
MKNINKYRFSLFILVIFTIIGAVQAQSAVFTQAVNYPTGAYPFFVKTGDFNGDGKQDLVTANADENSISVLLGNGNGTFQTAINTSVGNRLVWIDIGDFNSDNKTDLALTNYFGNNVAVLLGNGDGTFQSPVYYPTGSRAYSVDVGDVNNDNKADLTVLNYNCYQCLSSFSVLLGNGNGTFQNAVNYPVDGYGSQSHELGDLNNDGKLDVVTSNADSNSLSVLMGNGNGTFQSPTNYSTGQNPVVVTLGDFNADNILDTAVTNYFNNNVSVRFGNGDGTFQAAINYVVGTNPGQVITGDFDNNGSLDLASVNVNGNSISLLYNNGNGTFQPTANYLIGASPFSLAAADFNGDGRLDISAANRNDNNVSVLLNSCDNTAPTTNAAPSLNANSAGWNNTDINISLSANDNTAGTGVSEITYSASGAQTIDETTVDGANVNLTITAEGVTVISYYAHDNAGNTEEIKTLTVRIDKTAPSVSCDAANNDWHAGDVSIACTAEENVSQLENASDANFNLVTSVPSGTETANASTDSRLVCDVAGNCVTAGAIGGNKVDKKAPVITIISPTAQNYLLNQVVTVDFDCSDGGSGVASCSGTTADGSALDTASVGSKTLTVNATDNVGNTSSPSVVNYTVGFGIEVLFDQTKAHKSGSTVPIKIRLVDANGANVSSVSTVVHAVSVVLIATQASTVLDDAGNSNPDFDFRYDPALGGYIFNLKTTGYGTGTYQLNFIAGNNPTVYSVQFQVRQ